MKLIFGVDLGGTEIKIGKYDGTTLLEKYAIKTNKENNGSHIISDICDFISSNLDGEKLYGIGIGVPGPVSNGKVIIAANLGWDNYNVKEEILNRFENIKVYVGNDANMAALGEKTSGAKDFDSYCFVTLGTGVGGGVIVEGEIVEGAFGAGGEIGHMLAVKDGRKCGCGLSGCIERYASATGILQTANEQRIGKDTLLNSVSELTCKDVFDFAKQGDEVALSVVDYSCDLLAITLSQIATVTNPEAFIIGGGVSKAGQFLLDKIHNSFMKYAFTLQKNTDFALAQLGNDAGMFGAMYSVYKMK